MEDEDDVVKPLAAEQCDAAAAAAEGGVAVAEEKDEVGGLEAARVEVRDEMAHVGEDLEAKNEQEVIEGDEAVELEEQGKEVEGDELKGVGGEVVEEEVVKEELAEDFSKGEEVVVVNEEEVVEKEEESKGEEDVIVNKEEGSKVEQDVIENKEEGSKGDEDGIEKKEEGSTVVEDVIEKKKGSKDDEDVIEKKEEDEKSMEEEDKQEVEHGSKRVSEEQVMVSQGENELKPDDVAEMAVEKLEDDESKGDGKGELVGEAEQEDDVESKGDDVVEEEEDDDESRANAIESSPVVAKDEEITGEEETETPTGDTEMEAEAETVKSGSGGKRKRGRNSNSKAGPARTPVRKTVGEDVCFICLDGGDLVLCDRRGCPKAYHPLCVDHDEEFFKTKDRWTCGWHLCNKCGKNAQFMCYTCTFSLCKGCCKDAVVFCVRGNKGFCESCMKTVMMIESTEQNEGQVAFDDKSSWEYLFKDYWIEQKRRFSITSDELAQARNPWKSSNASDKQQTAGDVHMNNNVIGSDTDSSSEKDVSTARRKSKRKPKSQTTKEAHSDSDHSSENEDASNNKKGKRPRRLTKSRSKDRANVDLSGEGAVEWASKELLEFVMHMKDGDKSVLTQFDVQGLLLEYIKRNKLRDPRRRSQIICDPMLQKLFGKPRVGHFEMLKLLESHFLLREDSQADDNNHGSVVDEVSHLDADDYTDSTLDAGKSKGRKSRKKGEDRGLPSNLDDYAAIDMHNINLIYLRRNLMESLMDDSEAFHDKVVGAFVRIRISGSNLKQDIYRLVQIIGTSKAAEPYRVGKRTTDVMLEILNLDKTEIVSIDSISNQEFTEDECKRLRQSIKCGLISRMTVGDVLEKARELQEVRVTDWLEAEILRLSHLRDRASEKGRKKELRECVEKLQVLKTPEERQRRLEEIPVIHADPKMDPNYESEDESEKDNRRRGSFTRPRESGFFRRDRDRDRDHFTPRKGSNDSWSASARPPNKNREFDRSLSGKGFSNRRDDQFSASQTNEHTWDNGVDKGTTQGHSWEKPRLTSSDPLINATTRTEYNGALRSDISTPAPEASQPPSGGAEAKVNETEKMWHYRDPTNKVQGPFSMSQLRKWSNTGYFPADLKIWRASQSEDESFLLTDALAGRFLSSEVNSSKPSNSVGPSIENPRNPAHARGSEYGGGVRYDSSSNLPSPTPGRSTPAKWSTASSSSPFQSNSQFQRSIERLPSPTPTSPLSIPSGVDRSNFSTRNSSVMGNKEEASSASIASATASSVAANSTGQFYSTSVPRPPAQPMANPADVGMGQQANLRPDAVNNMAAAQGGFSNVVQPPTGAMQTQPHPVYNAQGGWAPPAPGSVNPSMMPNSTNTVVAPQVPYPQWTGAPVVANQAPVYGAGYPPGPPPNFPVMPPQNAWGPTPTPTPTNMPWGGQMAVPPGGAMGQMPAPPPMPSGNAMPGWPGQGPTNVNTNANQNPNQGWMAPPSGNANTWTGDQNRRGGGGPQWNRQSSFGSGGGSGGGGAGPGTPRGQGVCWYHESGHCKKGSSCNYMHS